MIYEPNDDTFLIAEQVEKFAKGKVLDLGTGSGYLAEIALEKTKDVLAADISEEVVEFVKKKGIKVVKSDLFSNINDKFDLIIFNPPYLPLDQREPKDSRLSTTGGLKGSEVLERFLKDAKSYLNENGKILIVFSSLTKDTMEIIKNYNYKAEKLSEKKLFFEAIYCYLLY